MKNKGHLLLTLVIAASFLLVAPVGSQAQSFLTKPIEFVVLASAGGGSDLMARFIQSVIDKEKLCSQPVAVVNRPGGSGAIAIAYVAGKKGDPLVWLTANTTFLTTPMLGKSKYNFKDFTPISNLAYDDFMVAVKADSPWKTMKDVIEDAKKRPGQIKTGGTSAPGTDALVGHLISREGGVKFNYIPYKSGGEAMIALLGGNLDVTFPNPGEALAQMEAKKVRILGVASTKRLAGAPDIPTLKELGYNVSMQMMRSIAAPKDIPQEAVKYYEELFRKVANSTTWKEKYIKENLLTWDYTTSAETQKLWVTNSEFAAKTLKEMGVIK